MGRLFTDGRIERVPARRKVRAAVLLEVVGRERQEIPAWEAHWLPAFLSGPFLAGERRGKVGT